MSELANISVIIPVYCGAATIDRTLASVAAQTIMPREIIVVDDGSNDGTEEKVKAWSRRFGTSKLIVLKQNHRGPGAARNKALSQASSEYVAFLDADDEWLPSKLEKSLAVIQQTNSNIVSHNYIMVSSDKISCIDCSNSYKKNKNVFVGYFLRGYIATSTVVALKSILIAAGGFQTELPSGQDYELWLVALDLSEARFHIFDEPLTRYHVTANSISSKIALRQQCALDIAHQHAFRLHRHCRYPALVLALRTLIIHAQAALGFISQSQYGKLTHVCFSLPVKLFLAFGQASHTPVTRPNFLQMSHD